MSATKVLRLTVRQRQSVDCPRCYRKAGRPCAGSRIPGPSTLGGGWGGPPELDREHPVRVAAARVALAVTVEVISGDTAVPCQLCGAKAVVALPPRLLSVQPDSTTHVCHPGLGGCNHGFTVTSVAS